MKTLTTTLRALSTALLISSCSIGTALAQQYKWDMPSEYSSNTVQGQGDQHFSKLLFEKSKGEIKITHHWGGALGYKSQDQLDAVETGAIVIANTFIPTLGGVNPIFLLSALPFLVNDTKEAKLLFEISKPYYDEVLQEHNQKLLFASPWPSSGLWGKKPLNNLQSVQQIKLRTYDPNGTKTFKNVGASPIQLSWGDIVPQLSTGGIEAVLTSVEVGLDASFNDYTKFFTDIHYDSTINLITMNLDTYNDLSPELQKAVDEAAKETQEFVWKNIDHIIDEINPDAQKKGVTVVTDIDPEFKASLKKAAEPVIEEWAHKAGSKGKKLLEQYKEALAKQK